MILKNYIHLFLTTVFIVGFPGCGKQAMKADEVLLLENGDNKASKTPRKARGVLKKSKAFVLYAQGKYAQEIALIGSSQDFAEPIAKERYVKKIKEIAMNNYAQSAPLHCYQFECENNAYKARDLMKRLQRISSVLVEPEDKKTLELLVPIERTLKIVSDMIRVDLDFLRDRQAHLAYANSLGISSQLSTMSMLLSFK